MSTAQRLLAWTVAAAALVAVSLAYLRPQVIVDLANKVWSCF